jgi:hypothetical protein
MLVHVKNKNIRGKTMLKAYAMALAVSTTAPIADNTKESVNAPQNNNKSAKTVIVDTTNSYKGKKKAYLKGVFSF